MKLDKTNIILLVIIILLVLYIIYNNYGKNIKKIFNDIKNKFNKNNVNIENDDIVEEIINKSDNMSFMRDDYEEYKENEIKEEYLD